MTAKIAPKTSTSKTPKTSKTRLPRAARCAILRGFDNFGDFDLTDLSREVGVPERMLRASL